MSTSATKWFTLPFSTQKSRDPFGSEVEAAAIFALAESERTKGSGLILRQPGEKIVFLSKIGYPIWLFPKNNATYAFDGFGDSNYSISYPEVPSTKVFIDNLEANTRPREKYTTFLSDHADYFQQSTKENQFVFTGLIVDSDFKNEFSVYRKEATEIITEPNLALLSPMLEEMTISSMISKFDKFQSFLREETEKLPECTRIINRTTSQYIAELDYEATAVKEETDAKIKAQEEFVKPQIVKLNKEYKRKIKNLEESFDKDIDRLQKLKEKILKYIEDNSGKIELYQSEAKAHAIKKHVSYEKRWKEKIKQTQKELNALKKELKNIENTVKKLSKQKFHETSKLNFELDAEIKFARHPLFELEATRDAKILSFKIETDKLLEKEKPLVEGLNKSVKLREAIKANFDALSITDQGLKNTTLFFVPFYVVCYEMGAKRRYLIIPPSIIKNFDFSARVKGVFGMSKIKDLLVSSFKSITALIARVQVLSKEKAEFEILLRNLGERNNVLKNRIFLENIEKGLVLLNHEGWLSDKEQKVLTRRLRD